MRKFAITSLLLICCVFISVPTHAMTDSPSLNLQAGSGDIYLPYISTISTVTPANFDVRVNVPYFSGDAADHFNEAAVFWFGRVTTSENYADIRFAYDNTKIWIYMSAFDQYMWYELDTQQYGPFRMGRCHAASGPGW